MEFYIPGNSKDGELRKLLKVKNPYIKSIAVVGKTGGVKLKAMSTSVSIELCFNSFDFIQICHL
ncbi:hypothetical protein Hdeb2414_s0015g00446011 [Helianthus debilis subsp. tardiflorus]